MKCILFLLLLLPFAGECQRSVPSSPQQDIDAYRSYLWDHLPGPTGWVNDYEGILSKDEEAALTARIDSLNISANAQFCVVTIDTMAVSREYFNILVGRIANVWGVGKKGVNNGITIGICKGYRLIRICNGRGVEARLTDAETKEIIDRQMTPLFKDGAFYKGILAGINALAARLSAKK